MSALVVSRTCLDAALAGIVSFSLQEPSAEVVLLIDRIVASIDLPPLLPSWISFSYLQPIIKGLREPRYVLHRL